MVLYLLPPLSLKWATVLFIGAVVDRYGRKIVLLSGLLTAALLLFLLSITKNLYVIFCINAAHGMAAGAILVSSLALLTDYAPEHRRGREMGAFDAFNMLGWIVGYALGALFLEFFKGSLGQTFLIAGAMAAIWVRVLFFQYHRAEETRCALPENQVQHDYWTCSSNVPLSCSRSHGSLCL